LVSLTSAYDFTTISLIDWDVLYWILISLDGVGDEVTKINLIYDPVQGYDHELSELT